MLDSGCMMLDDQEMPEEWIMRVQGKEYGPADIETLREWKAEGRLLPGNEARRADVDLWITAAEIPGLFDVATPVAASTRRPAPPRLGFIAKALCNSLVLRSSWQCLPSPPN